MAERVTITASVGRNGTNHLEDAIKVVELLNQVPADQGGPPERLRQVNPQALVDAIERFQRRHFRRATYSALVRPDGPTLAKLNELTGRTGVGSWKRDYPEE